MIVRTVGNPYKEQLIDTFVGSKAHN